MFDMNNEGHTLRSADSASTITSQIRMPREDKDASGRSDLCLFTDLLSSESCYVIKHINHGKHIYLNGITYSF